MNLANFENDRTQMRNDMWAKLASNMQEMKNNDDLIDYYVKRTGVNRNKAAEEITNRLMSYSKTGGKISKKRFL